MQITALVDKFHKTLNVQTLGSWWFTFRFCLMPRLKIFSLKTMFKVKTSHCVNADLFPIHSGKGLRDALWNSKHTPSSETIIKILILWYITENGDFFFPWEYMTIKTPVKRPATEPDPGLALLYIKLLDHKLYKFGYWLKYNNYIARQ